jgi:hypothetical protein
MGLMDSVRVVVAQLVDYLLYPFMVVVGESVSNKALKSVLGVSNTGGSSEGSRRTREHRLSAYRIACRSAPFAHLGPLDGALFLSLHDPGRRSQRLYQKEVSQPDAGQGDESGVFLFPVWSAPVKTRGGVGLTRSAPPSDQSFFSLCNDSKESVRVPPRYNL